MQQGLGSYNHLLVLSLLSSGRELSDNIGEPRRRASEQNGNIMIYGWITLSASKGFYQVPAAWCSGYRSTQWLIGTRGKRARLHNFLIFNYDNFRRAFKQLELFSEVRRLNFQWNQRGKNSMNSVCVAICEWNTCWAVKF